MLPLLISLVTACGGNNELTADIIVYENNFEDGDFENITGASSERRFGSQVIGAYNNDGFSLHLSDLPRHEYIYISFTLYILDTWDGNTNGLTPDRPDKWIMAVNSGITPSSLDSYTGFETTFSNGPCDGVLCLTQSYPNSFPHTVNPRTGARTNRIGRCANRGVRGASSEYFIERTFRHDDPAIIFNFYDELYQPNVADQKCDESWAMDNLTVRAITIN
ncbi:MAG: hypothetical protein Roseis2KO_22490 [Roseivirga sp.]